ncbi:PQQ-binding-like beta-propeller repeat protein [Pseudomarimonas arenosa]|uniref:PQQ-binding-like beta-propeller repeat protein n=1 Tax=Pseudomarimonas arenosa TaxID=2774145 RepID=A0AAW3ZL41_9GAMM|nr:PQQ-binding-like beta-propeller repeat protein [Pseudomarimonas arenosa]MBD8525640.1 PQQ-binding-like beta-propeller repeat protein [Pseudomarimonas arenosa]
MKTRQRMGAKNSMGAIALSLIYASAQATEWSAAPEPSINHVRIERVLGTEQGYIAVLGDQWLRFDQNDQPLSRHRLAADPQRPAAWELVNLGGSRFAYPPYGGEQNLCRIDVLNEDGQITLESGFSITRDLCFADLNGDVLDGGQGLYLSGSHAVRVQRDGRSAALPSLDASSLVYATAAMPDSASAYVLYRHNRVDTIARVDREQLVWSKTFEGDSTFMLRAVVAANGDALVAGVRLVDGQFSFQGVLTVARYSPEGELRWQREFPELPLVTELQIRLLAEDRLLFMSHEPSLQAPHGPTTFGVLNGDGSLRWSRLEQSGMVAALVDDAGGKPQTAAPNFAYLLWPSFEHFTYPEVVRLLDSDGNQLLETAASIDPFTLSTVLPDGSLVMGSVDHDSLFRDINRWGPDGVLRSKFTLQLPTLEREEPLTAASLGNDSASVALGAGQVEVKLLNAEGDLQWSRSYQPESGHVQIISSAFSKTADSQARLLGNHDRVCIGPMRYKRIHVIFSIDTSSHVQCYSRDDGTPVVGLSPALLADDAAVPASDYALLSDNRVLAIETECAGCSEAQLKRVEISADGQSVQRRTLSFTGLGKLARSGEFAIEGPNVLAQFGSGGEITLYAGSVNGQLKLAHYDAQGALLGQFASGLASGVLLRSETLSDGTQLVHSWHNQSHRLAAFHNGSLRWLREFNAPLAHDVHPASGAVGNPAFAFHTDGEQIALFIQESLDGGLSSRLMRLDAGSGDTLWQQQDRNAENAGMRTLRVSQTLNSVLLASDRPQGGVLRAFSLQDGKQLGARGLGCEGRDDCRALRMSLAADASLRVYDASGWLLRYELDDVLQPAVTAQAGLSGTWYEPATNGQGLLLDYNVEQAQLLAAWFTYADPLSFDPSGLRWYTLQGALPTAAGKAELQIYRNQHGAFDSEPMTQAERVGSAELQLRHCSELLLSYRFDGGEVAGLSGVVPLTRLSPNVFDCENADGSVVSAQPASPAASSFQAGQTGAWYTPATSGQGLLFDIRPPSADGSDPGVLLGGWFTYDVEGLEDDETAQHWFLLQGDLAGADSNGAQVPIYRSTGGRFDQRATSNIHRVGIATVRLNGCTSGELSYQFDDSDVAGEFAARQGSMSLVKLLGCVD